MDGAVVGVDDELAVEPVRVFASADRQFQGELFEHTIVGGLEVVIGKRAEDGAWFGDVLDEELVGAFVADRDAFESVVAKTFNELSLASFEFEDVEPLSERVSKWVVDDNLLELASEVESGGGVRFGTFHSFMKTD